MFKKILLFGTMCITLMIGCANKTSEATIVEKEYPMTTVVVDIDEKTQTIYVVDFNGEEWSFVEPDVCAFDEWQISCYASLIMSDNGTDLIYDDKIVSHKYDGWCRGEFGYDAETELPVVEFYE